ncbi:MAG: FAD-dependent monooxygenase, partial [Actinomycetia bacterium]|nr:FAD-dependent monooxygenase [Actinomycetes bacterium]
MTDVRTAMIVGGGIAGPTAAIALQKAGIEATVYEAHPAGADAAGAFMTLGSNGIAALYVLGAADRVVERGFATPSINLRSYTGKSLGCARIDASGNGDTPSHTLKRTDLYQSIRDEAVERGIHIAYGRRLVDAVDEAGSVRATFADGSTATADVLVGCDGVHSTVRRLIDPNAPSPAYAGLIGTGGYTGDIAVETEPGAYEMIFGKRAFLGYVTAPDGEVWWFANVPRAAEPARGEAEAESMQAWRDRLQALYADDAGPGRELVDATESILPMSPIHTLARLPHWHRGRMVVIGDAAHAPSPSSGQGASLSVEDAIVLAKSLRDAPDVSTAMDRFETSRRPRVEKIIRQAARVNSSKAAGPIA